jgi:hypothetical protein
MSERILLLQNAAGTGDDFRWPGGSGCLVASGVFNNYRVQLEMLGPDGITFVPAPGAVTLGAPCAALFTLP